MSLGKVVKEGLKSTYGNKKRQLSILVVLLTPLLFAICYVIAFWNPTDYLENLPVAIINTDNGAEFNNEQVNFGENIIENLKDPNSNTEKKISWQIINKEEYTHIADSEYYFVFIIPEDFSEKVVSASKTSPQTTEIIYISDKRKNFTASQLANSIQLTFKATVASAITNEYVDTMYTNLYDVKDGMKEAAKGSTEIQDGIKRLSENIPTLSKGIEDIHSGSVTIEEKLGDLNKGMTKLDRGGNQLTDGMDSLSQGATAIADGTAKLSTGANTLNNGLNSLDSQMGAVKEGAAKLNDGTKQVATGLKGVSSNLSASQASMDEALAQVSAALSTASQSLAIGDSSTAQSCLDTAAKAMAQITTSYDSGQAQLQGAVGQLAAGASQTAEGAEALSKGINNAAAGISQLADGSDSLNNGLSSLNNSVPTFTNGVTALKDGVDSLGGGIKTAVDGTSLLHDGAKTLTEGTGKLNDAVPELADGTNRLYDGSRELTSALKDGYDELAKGLITTPENMAEFVSSPLDIDEKDYGTDDTYGMGFSPFFICLAAWVGSLIMFFVISPRPNPILNPNRLESAYGQLPATLLLATLQGFIIGIGTIIVGVEVNHPVYFFIYLVGVCLLFNIIISSLMVSFGTLPGKSISMILLIVQLCSCGGTFPAELINPFFKALNPYMPFTYAVEGFKEIMYGHDKLLVSHDIFMLIIFGVFFLALSFILEGLGKKINKAMASIEE